MAARPNFGRNGRVRPIDVIAVAALVFGIWFVADVMGWIGPSLCVSPSSDDKPVCDTVTAAIHADQEVPSSESIALARSQGLSSDAWASAGSAKFTQYFTGDVLVRKIDILRQDAESYGRPEALTDSEGVRNIVVRTIAISGDSATVTAQAELWAISVIPRPWGRTASETASAAGTYDWSFHLTKTSGSWLIDGEDGQFAPGNGP
ncbi:MAG: hypothetical protein ABSG37_14825 [Candidatus Limnocylindrales bacterium]|jgi:hypothetical protein